MIAAYQDARDGGSPHIGAVSAGTGLGRASGERTGGDPGDGRGSGHVANHDRARADRGPGSDRATGKHRDPEPEKRSLPDRDLAREMRARRDVREVADRTIVIDGRPGVENRVTTEHGIGLDHGPGKDHRALAHPHRRVDDRLGMHDGGPGERELGSQPLPGAIVANAKDGALSLCASEALGNGAHDLDPEQLSPAAFGVVVPHLEHRTTGRLQGRHDHFSVAPGTDDDHASLGHELPDTTDRTKKFQIFERRSAILLSRVCMGRVPRYIPPGGALVEVTYRTFQGRFLLRPSSALNDIVLGVLARALSRYPKVGLVGIVVLSNHLHLLLSVESQADLSKVMAVFGNKSAREINKLYGRSGSIWGHRYRSICVTRETSAQIARLDYLLSQAVKEGLVAKVEEWPGIHFGKTLLQGRSLLAGKWIDRTKKCRKEARGKPVDPKEYTTTLTAELVQLPCWAHLRWDEYLKRIRERVETIEAEAALDRESRGVEILGVEAVCQREPEAQPRQETERTPAPRVHAASKKERAEWKEAFSIFLEAYRAASELLRGGDRSAMFPEGCFPPGLPFVGLRSGLATTSG